MTLASWSALLAVCALGAMSPGPSLAVVAGHALTGSRGRGIACAIAHALGVGVYAVATVAGLAAVLAAHPTVHAAIVAAGALYLVWLGMGLLRSAGAPETGPAPAGTGWAAAARDGLAMALVNPKIALFFAAVFSQFVGPADDWQRVAVLCATAIAVDGAWYSLVAAVLTTGGWIERLRAGGVWLDRTMGGLLLALAGATAIRVVTGNA